jgi:hypothetical protein
VGLVCQGAVTWAGQQPFFDRWAQSKALGGFLRTTCQSWVGPVLSADGEVGFSVEFGNDFPMLISEHSYRMVRLQACPGEAEQRDSMIAKGVAQAGCEATQSPPFQLRSPWQLGPFEQSR